MNRLFPDKYALPRKQPKRSEMMPGVGGSLVCGRKDKNGTKPKSIECLPVKNVIKDARNEAIAPEAPGVRLADRNPANMRGSHPGVQNIDMRPPPKDTLQGKINVDSWIIVVPSLNDFKLENVLKTHISFSHYEICENTKLTAELDAMNLAAGKGLKKETYKYVEVRLANYDNEQTFALFMV